MAFYVGQRVRAGSLPATVLQVYAEIGAVKVKTDSGHEITYDFAMLTPEVETETQSKARAGAKNKARAPGEDKAS